MLIKSWVGYYTALGVQGITLYYSGTLATTPELVPLLNELSEISNHTLFFGEWNKPYDFYDKSRKIYRHNSQPVAMNSWLYRSKMMGSKWIMYQDFDEFTLLGSKYSSFPQMFATADNSCGFKFDAAWTLVFNNANHVLDRGNVSSGDSLSVSKNLTSALLYDPAVQYIFSQNMSLTRLLNASLMIQRTHDSPRSIGKPTVNVDKAKLVEIHHIGQYHVTKGVRVQGNRFLHLLRESRFREFGKNMFMEKTPLLTTLEKLMSPEAFKRLSNKSYVS